MYIEELTVTELQDGGVPEDNRRLVKETVEQLGGLDVIIANAGWTRFSNFGDLNDLSLDEWNKVRTPNYRLIVSKYDSVGQPTSCHTWYCCKKQGLSSRRTKKEVPT